MRRPILGPAAGVTQTRHHLDRMLSQRAIALELRLGEPLIERDVVRKLRVGGGVSFDVRGRVLVQPRLDVDELSLFRVLVGISDPPSCQKRDELRSGLFFFQASS